MLLPANNLQETTTVSASEILIFLHPGKKGGNDHGSQNHIQNNKNEITTWTTANRREPQQGNEAEANKKALYKGCQ